VTGEYQVYETSSVSLREEDGLTVLREVSGATKGEVTGDWRKLHGEALHASYPSTNNTR
jgi:hypothetical protein